MWFFYLFMLLVVVYGAPKPNQEIELRMPDVQPQEPDTYLCKAYEVKEDNLYLTGFQPHADSKVAHHILLYGCGLPGGNLNEVWNCGEMVSKDSNYRSGSVCEEGNNIIYAWAMDAPSLHLPQDVSFDVGRKAPIRYLVVQVHYKNVDNFKAPNNQKDNSGLTLMTSNVPTSRKAGVYLMLTDGYIPSHTIEYFEVACKMTEPVELFPFAFRTHGHSLGRVISGYRIRNDTWTEIGRKDPRLPEMFYNATTPGLNIVKGDILAARCTMENTFDRPVSIGSTQNDEMCNFYMMYYVEKSKILEQNACFSGGPPQWYWSDFPGINLETQPATISVIPGTDKPLIRNATYETLPQAEAGQFKDINFENEVDEALKSMEPQELLSIAKSLDEEEQQRELMAQWQRESMLQDYLNDV